MPPPVYGSPAIRAANSADRSPANTRCAWRVDEAGDHRRAAGVEALVGGGRVARGPTHATRPPSMTTAASASVPSGGAVGVVGDQLADPVDQQAHRAADRPPLRDRRRSAAAHVGMRSVPAVADHEPPVDHHVRTSAAVAANTASGGRQPAVRTESRATVTRSARAPTRDRAGVGPAERGVPAGGGRAHQRGRREVAAPPGRAAARAVPRRGPPRTGRSPRASRSRGTAGCRRRRAPAPARARRRGRVRWWGTGTRRCRSRRARRGRRR